ncbi:SMI1/KNR4 family protein [Paenibacillus pinisoli]|uniref:SMI1/KNR4 family protein n=1 Tax=Paenibacillus pinisoli TaxID=1276110 RepID=A0A3A6PPQ1_9BACL|nr:SMI1/KNR4 family protein [Paenibacillus pinisoli]RJX41646.1 SMI1/KNR4 family protein [Paenibacillus pinisoli]
MDVLEIIEKVKGMPDCTVLPPKGLPQIEVNVRIPDDLQKFYESCGGLILFQHADYQVNILSPQDFVLANPVIIGEMCEEDISSNWYIIASDSSGEYLTIDLKPLRIGKCYDSFFDRHGVVGETQIIAMSFTELLNKLIQSKGQYWYWLDKNFVSLGDAYGLI